MKPVEVTREGAWPIMKYTVRGGDVGYHMIMLDDKSGEILIDNGDQHAFKHYWTLPGRVDETLRGFLVRINDGYVKDKLSYGLSRWDGDLAEKKLIEALTKKLGEDRDEWDAEIQELVDTVAGDHLSPDAYYGLLQGCEPLMELFHHDHSALPGGEASENKKVKQFVDKAWPHFVRFWKKELELNVK